MVEIDFEKRELKITLFNGDEVNRYPDNHFWVGNIIQWKFPLDDEHFTQLRNGRLVKDLSLWYDRSELGEED